MFLALLAVTFLIALATAGAVVQLFRASATRILHRVVSEELAFAWRRYLSFALYIVGISSGVRIWDLEKYITPRTGDAEAISLNTDRWVLEVYRTLIGTLQGTAWVLLVFLVFALIAYVITRGFELRRSDKT